MSRQRHLRATGRRQLIVVALTALTLFGCGYRLAGGGGLPEHIKVLVVTPFENRTTRPEIEQRVTEEVARELSTRGKYRVITDRTVADAVLEGAITSYRASPIQFGEDLLASQMEAVVTLSATLRDVANDEVLWSQSGLVFRGQFEVQADTSFYDQETIALDDIAEGAADVLVTSIFEGW